MKLAPIGGDPDYFGLRAEHVFVHDATELLEASIHWLFYYVILETKPQVLFC